MITTATRENYAPLAEDPEVFFSKIGKENAAADIGYETSSTINKSAFVDKVASIFHPVTYNGKLYLYNDSTGLYSYKSNDKLYRWISSVINLAIYDGRFNPETSAKEIIDELYQQIKDYNIITGDYPFNHYPGVPLEDYVVHIDQEIPRAETYTPEMMFSRKFVVK